MAEYTDANRLKRVFASNIWTNFYSPGQKVPVSGIYACHFCGQEDACNKGNPFPPHPKPQNCGSFLISWKLVVKTNS